jgi:uncharacterized protein
MRPALQIALLVAMAFPPATSAAAEAAGSAPKTTAAASRTRVAVAQPVKLSPLERDSLTAAMLKDREDTRKWLASDTSSYLATIERRDFGPKSALTVGAASDNDVKVAGLQPHHLRVTVIGDSFHVEALDAGAGFTVRGADRRDAVLGPSAVGLGRYRLRLSHQRFPALIVFDPQSPRFKEYKGLEYFPVDLSYRYVLPLTPNPRPDTVVILSTRGNTRHALRVGWFDFAVKGKACRLEVSRLLEPGVGENGYSVFMRDATTDKETYAVGRYIDPEQLPDGRFVLDFNLAYNPACAVSEHYNCPIPRKQNTLSVAIRAGEKDSHYLH